MTMMVGAGAEARMSDPTWSLTVGDAWDLATTLPESSIDAIVTSPPYWGLRSYGLEHNTQILAEWVAEGGSKETTPPYEWYREHGGVLGLEPVPAWFVAHLVEIFDRLASSLTADSSVWVNLGDTYFGRWASIRDEGRQGLSRGSRLRRVTPSWSFMHDKQLLMIPARFAIAMQDRGWILRNDLIWQKPNVAPRPERDRLRLSHEHLFHFVKRRSGGRPSYYYDVAEAEPGGRDVVSVNTQPSTGGHSATFPLELIRPRIRSSTPAGGTVLDPFTGTGTTLLSALQERRSAIGFELSERYANSARERLSRFPTTSGAADV